MSLFCKHDWEKVSETTMPSGFEQVVASGQQITKSWGHNVFIKTHVVILKCKKCGKIYDSVTRS